MNPGTPKMTHFGVTFPPKSDPKNDPKICQKHKEYGMKHNPCFGQNVSQKWVKKCPKMGQNDPFLAHFWTIFDHLLIGNNPNISVSPL